MMVTFSCFQIFVLVSFSLLNLCDAGGLIGYGISRWQPRCAYICRYTIATCSLTCTKIKGTKKTTSTDCYASNDAFLETLAYCIESRCTTLELWEGEKFWTEMATGSPAVAAKWSYGETLQRIMSPPDATIAMKKALNVTSKTRDHDFQITWNTYADNECGQAATSQYAIVLIVSGLLIPIVFSLLRFVPLPRLLVNKVSSYLILPATWGMKHRTPVGRNIGICPTRGQSLFIFYLVILNILLCTATYRFVPISEQTKYDNYHIQLMTNMGNRIGVLTCANLALMVLYAGRNNFLLWVTKWQRKTFLLFHHWVGYIVIFEGAIHASIYLHLYLTGNGDDDWSTENKEDYWIWGTVAVISMTLILPLSILPIRQRVYEVFLASHRLLALLVLIGVFLHAFLKNSAKGFHNWIYAAFAALSFDYLMRILRVARNGVRMAEITIIDGEYIRVDVRGVDAEGHAFVYFPSLTWRVWENHPFSVAASVHDYLPFHTHHRGGSNASDSGFRSVTPDSTSEKGDLEKGILSSTSGQIITATPVSQTSTSPPSENPPTRPSAGITFFIRRQTGLTSLFASRTRLPVLVESSYGSLHASIMRYPNLIAIAGGVGIVTVLPLLRSHPGRAKLYWGLRTPGLLEALGEDVKCMDREITVGRRMDVQAILESEISGKHGKAAVVVVSGPGSLADEVRRVVVEMGRREGAWPVKLVDESFG